MKKVNLKNVIGRIFGIKIFGSSIIRMYLEVVNTNLTNQEITKSDFSCLNAFKSLNLVFFKNNVNHEMFDFILKLKNMQLVDAYVEVKQQLNKLTQIEETVYIVDSIQLLDDMHLKTDFPIAELFLKTKMSVFDSTIDIKYLIDQLKKFNYRYLGVTDSNSIQSFPEFESLCQNAGIKPIFGLNLSFFEPIDAFHYVKNKKIVLKSAKYVVLDLETNGLDYLHDPITEIAWVVMQESQIIDKFSALIKQDADFTVKEFVVSLTGITDTMLQTNGKDFATVLKHLFNAVNDENTILVSHNKFDLRKLKHDFNTVLNIDFQPNYIDSKDVFKIAFPDLKRFNLNFVTSSLEIEMLNHHRALDDAAATCYSFKRALEKLDCETTLENLHYNVEFRHQNDFECYVIAKNSAGKQNLHEIVSKMYTDYFYKYPRIPFEELQRYRENVYLVGSLFREGEILNKNYFYVEDMNSVISRYDFIQLPPFSNLLASLKQLDKDSYLIDEIGLKVFYDNIVQNFPEKILISSSPINIFPTEAVISKILRSTFGYERNIHDLSFKTFEQMQDLYDFDITQFHKNNIALCESVSYDTAKQNALDLIRFFPSSSDAQNTFFQIVQNALTEKYGSNTLPEIRERVDHECKKILDGGFTEVYLLSYYVIKYVIERFNIIIGSRGSIGSSFVAFLLDITNVNPLFSHIKCEKCFFTEKLTEKSGFDCVGNMTCIQCGGKLIADGHDIMFEIFSGFDEHKLPDIDLNVPTNLHEEIRTYIINILREKFNLTSYRGSMITTLQSKNAFFYIKRFMIEKQLFDESSKNSIELLAEKTVGVKLSMASHPGGILIMPYQYIENSISPIQNSKDEYRITHFDCLTLKNIFKLDILAHDDPNTLQSLLEKNNVKFNAISVNDRKIMELFTEHNSPLGIPEFGTTFTRKLVSICRPNNFSDLVRISGLTHGTNVWTNNAELLVFQEEKSISEVISTRDDIFDFLFPYVGKNKSFEIMEFIRKGRGRTNKMKWNEYRETLENARVPDWFINSCEKIEYLFPRAHAVAYVIMALKIAYFKVYFPLQFYVAYLNRKREYFELEFLLMSDEQLSHEIGVLNVKVDIDNKHKNILQIMEIIREIRNRGINFSSVDLYKSDSNEFICCSESNTIFPPFSIIKGFGDTAGDSIIKTRCETFKNIFDFKKRTNLTAARIKLLQTYNILNLKDVVQNDLF